MRYDGTRYSGIDFAQLNEVSNSRLESIRLHLQIDIAELQVGKELVLFYAMTINKVKMQLKLVEEEIAERILLDQWDK